MLERFVNGHDVFIFQPALILMNLRLQQLCQSTKRQIKLNVDLKRQNSQANRSITFYKDSDTSLWRSQAKLFFK